MNDFPSKQSFIYVFSQRIKEGRPVNILFLNDHGFNIAQKDRHFRAILNQADYLLNDGIGIKLGAKIWGVRIRENLNGTDLIPLILSVCEQTGKSIFMLGSTDQNVGAAVNRLRDDFPKLKIAGYHHGYFRSDRAMVETINRSHCDVLLVGLGMPLQEKFIADHNKELACTVRVAVGGFIDFASGNVPRAPKLMRRLNLEWLFRMAVEPRRLWRRNVIGHVQFFYKIIRLKLLRARLKN